MRTLGDRDIPIGRLQQKRTNSQAGKYKSHSSSLHKWGDSQLNHQIARSTARLRRKSSDHVGQVVNRVVNLRPHKQRYGIGWKKSSRAAKTLKFSNTGCWVVSERC